MKQKTYKTISLIVITLLLVQVYSPTYSFAETKDDCKDMADKENKKECKGDIEKKVSVRITGEVLRVIEETNDGIKISGCATGIRCEIIAEAKGDPSLLTGFIRHTAFQESGPSIVNEWYVEGYISENVITLCTENCVTAADNFILTATDSPDYINFGGGIAGFLLFSGSGTVEIK